MSDEVLNDVIPSAEFDSPFDESMNWKTVVSPTEGGSEFRYGKWIFPKKDWRIIADARNQEEMNNIWRFYQRRQGALDTFLFENPNESPVLEKTGAYDVFATGDGVNDKFYLGTHQLCIPTGDVHVIPNTFSMEKSVGGTGDWTAVSTGDYSLEETVGMVDFDSAVDNGDVLRADYRFRYRARFQQDKLSRRNFAYLLWASEIEIIQVI